jgi:hypothetical protein
LLVGVGGGGGFDLAPHFLALVACFSCLVACKSCCWFALVVRGREAA